MSTSLRGDVKCRIAESRPVVERKNNAMERSLLAFPRRGATFVLGSSRSAVGFWGSWPTPPTRTAGNPTGTPELIGPQQGRQVLPVSLRGILFAPLASCAPVGTVCRKELGELTRRSIVQKKEEMNMRQHHRLIQSCRCPQTVRQRRRQISSDYRVSGQVRRHQMPKCKC